MKEIIDGLLPIFKVAGIETNDPRLFKEGTEDYLEKAELAAVLNGITTTAFTKHAATHSDAATRKALKTKQTALAAKYGAASDLDIDAIVEFATAAAFKKAEDGNKQDFTKYEIEDFVKIAPQLGSKINILTNERLKEVAAEKDAAVSALNEYKTKGEKQKHHNDVLTIAKREFLLENPNLVEDATKSAKQLDDFLKLYVSPDKVKIEDGVLLETGEDGEPILSKTTYVAQRLVETLRSNWIYGFNKVPALQNGAPPPAGGGTTTGFTMAMQNELKAASASENGASVAVKLFANLKANPVALKAAKTYWLTLHK